MSVLVYDRIAYAITRREYTDEGFLRVPGRVARVGIQQYLATELGLKDRNPNEIINVYRPAEEVFKPESLASYDCKDVTDDHPPEMVSAENHKELTVGVVSGSAIQDGDFVQAVLVIKDSDAIKKAEKGKVQLSAGYTAEYVYEPGITTDGEHYEFIQRDIRINHVALVDRARAGNQARIFDKQQEGVMPQVTLDKGVTVEVADNATAQLIQSRMDELRKRVADAESEKEKAKDEAEEAKAKADKKDEDLEEEKKKSSDSAIADRVKSVIDTKEKARLIAGKDFSCDSVNSTEIQRAALAMVRPSVDWAGKSAAYVQAAWDMEAEKKEAEDEEEEEAKKKAEDSLKNLGKAMADMKPGDAQAVRDQAYDEFLKNRHGKKEA